MPISNQHGMQWYKDHDPQGIQGFWLDLLLEVVIVGTLICVPLVAYLIIKSLLIQFNITL